MNFRISKNTEIADIVANLRVIADNLDETHQIESDTIRSIATTLIRTLDLEHDLVDVHYNPLLKNKPYLVRVYNWNNSEPTELRLDTEEVKDLYNTLQKYKLL